MEEIQGGSLDVAGKAQVAGRRSCALEALACAGKSRCRSDEEGTCGHRDGRRKEVSEEAEGNCRVLTDDDHSQHC